MEKRGQIQISFGMIFSIIIIVATVAVGFYVIKYFLNMNECTKATEFYNSLKTEVEKAYNGDITSKPFTKQVPSGVQKVCFGHYNQTFIRADMEAVDYLEERGITEDNVMLYPTGKACENELAIFNLDHAVTATFFCVPVKTGKITVMLTKGSTDVFVKLSKP